MKSNGSNRGALRPHYGGRAPPFLLAALLIGLVLIGFCYYNLSSQYSALEVQYRDLQERLRAVAEKRESLETRYDELKKTLEDNSKSLDERDKQLLQKEQDRAAVEAALRKKEDELMTKSREADTAAKALVRKCFELCCGCRGLALRYQPTFCLCNSVCLALCRSLFIDTALGRIDSCKTRLGACDSPFYVNANVHTAHVVCGSCSCLCEETVACAYFPSAISCESELTICFSPSCVTLPKLGDVLRD